MNVVIPLHMNVELTLSGHCSFFRRASTVGHIRCRLVSEHVIDQRAVGIDDISDVGIAWLCLGNVRREDVIETGPVMFTIFPEISNTSRLQKIS